MRASIYTKIITAFIFAKIGSFYSFAYADSIVSVKSANKQNTSQDVITIFGSSKNYTQPQYNQQNWNVDLNADLKTNLDCGKIQLSTDIKNTLDQLAKIPSKLATEYTGDMDLLLAAAPMMAVCWTDPVICAEIKNLNLNLTANIGLETNACHAINNFINDQNVKGQQEAYNKALNQCIAQNTNSDGSNALSARKTCEKDTNSVLVSDIINHKLNTTLSSAQNIIFSAVQSAGHYATQDDQDVYKILNASLGEMVLNVDGSVVPVLPDANTTYDASTLSGSFLATSVSLICNQTNFTTATTSQQTSSSSDPATRYIQNAVYKSVSYNLTTTDANNLGEIDPMDREILCQVLGRSVAQSAIQSFSAAGTNEMSAVIQNDYVPKDVRQTYQSKTGIFFSSLEKQLKTEEIFSITTIRKEIASLARSQREENQKLGSEMSAENRRSNQWWNLTDTCNSVYTCQ